MEVCLSCNWKPEVFFFFFFLLMAENIQKFQPVGQDAVALFGAVKGRCANESDDR